MSEEFYPPGTIVYLKEEYAHIYTAASGAVGVVREQVTEYGFDYYHIHWDQSDERCNGQHDGLVNCHHVAFKQPPPQPPDTDKRKAMDYILDVSNDETFSVSKSFALEVLEKCDGFGLVALIGDQPYMLIDAANALQLMRMGPLLADSIVAAMDNLSQSNIRLINIIKEQEEKLKEQDKGDGDS